MTPTLRWPRALAPGTYWWSVAPAQYESESVSGRFKLVLGTALDLGALRADATNGRYLFRVYSNSSGSVTVRDEVQHGKTLTKSYRLAYTGAYSETRTGQVPIAWDCARTGRHHTYVSVTVGSRVTKRHIDFSSPNCSWRFGASVTSTGTLYPRSTVFLALRDNWNLGAHYRVCVRGPKVNKCWNRATSKSEGSDEFDVYPSYVGNYNVTWSVGGKVFQRKAFTVHVKPPPSPPAPLYLDGDEASTFAADYTSQKVTGDPRVVSNTCYRWSNIEVHCVVWVDGYEYDFDLEEDTVTNSCVTTVSMIKRRWGIEASDDGC